MIRFPYRWLPSTFLKNIVHGYWDIRNGIENIWRYLPVIWWDRVWDFDGLLAILERRLSDSSECFDKYGCHVNSKRDAHRIKICAILCRRILADKYPPTYFNNRPNFKQSQRDMEYLGKLMGKHLLEWWD